MKACFDDCLYYACCVISVFFSYALPLPLLIEIFLKLWWFFFSSSSFSIIAYNTNCCVIHICSSSHNGLSSSKSFKNVKKWCVFSSSSLFSKIDFHIMLDICCQFVYLLDPSYSGNIPTRK